MSERRYKQLDFLRPRQRVARFPDKEFRDYLAHVDDQIISIGAPQKLTWQAKAVLRGLREERKAICALREQLDKDETPTSAPPPEAEDSLFSAGDTEGVFD